MKYIYDKLLILKNEKYKDFQSKLVPNILPSTIIGVKTPDLRKIAKEVFESEHKKEFLAELPHKFFEENLIHIFVIGLIKDFDECVQYIDKFLPYVDCWPVSDQGTPKVFKKHHDKLLSKIKEWIESDHTYTSRYGIRMLMNEFLGTDFKKEYLEIVATKKAKDYYLKMMISWFFATALSKKYNESIKYFEQHRLDKWIHNKSIQKAIESFRVSDEHKTYLKTLKV